MKYLFIHIPKTAGTSFNKFLVKRIGNIYPINSFTYNHIHNVNIDDFLSKNVVSGHYKYTDFDEDFLSNFKVMTFIRDPLKRFISNVKHILLSEFTNEELSYLLDNQLNLNMLNNVHMKRYGHNFSPYANSQLLRLADKGLNDFINKIETEKISFVGLTEFYEHSIKEFSKKFNIEISDEDLNLKINKYEDLKNTFKKDNYLDDMKISDEVHEMMDDIFKIDIELYDYVYNKFYKKYIYNW